MCYTLEQSFYSPHTWIPVPSVHRPPPQHRIAIVTSQALSHPLTARLPLPNPRAGAAPGGGLLAGLLLGAVVGFRVLPSAAPAASLPVAASAAIPFAAHGLAVVTHASELLDHPTRGRGIAPVPAGAVVSVGGVVRSAAGLAARDAFWVRLETDAGVRYGFLPSGEVQLSAGSPPTLDLGGIDVAALLAPRAGVALVPTGAGSGSSDAAVVAPGATGSAGSPASDALVTATGATAVAIPWLPASVRRWESAIIASAGTHGVDPNLLAIITLVESGGNPNAVSPSGAMGLMQVMPATALDIARRRGLTGFAIADLYDPATAIDFGAWYIAEMLRLFGQANDPDWVESVALAAAAYNGGPGAVQRLLASGTALPAEAQRYRHWVSAMWSERSGAESPGFRSWWDAGGSRLVQAAETAQTGG
jgi:hypothetical protein